jgi:hypothetical protein
MPFCAAYWPHFEMRLPCTDGNYQLAADWGLRALAEKNVWSATRGFTAAALAACERLDDAREIVAQMRVRSPGRRIGAVLNDLAYQDTDRRRLYGEHLRAAGYPD